MKNTERLALLFGLGNLLTAASQLRALVGPATILTGFPAGGQPPAAPSRAKHQGLNAGQQRPDRSSHSLHRSVKYNLHQGDPIQSILRLLKFYNLGLQVRHPIQSGRQFTQKGLNGIPYEIVTRVPISKLRSFSNRHSNQWSTTASINFLPGSLLRGTLRYCVAANKATHQELPERSRQLDRSCWQ